MTAAKGSVLMRRPCRQRLRHGTWILHGSYSLSSVTAANPCAHLRVCMSPLCIGPNVTISVISSCIVSREQTRRARLELFLVQSIRLCCLDDTGYFICVDSEHRSITVCKPEVAAALVGLCHGTTTALRLCYRQGISYSLGYAECGR